MYNCKELMNEFLNLMTTDPEYFGNDKQEEEKRRVRDILMLMTHPPRWGKKTGKFNL